MCNPFPVQKVGVDGGDLYVIYMTKPHLAPQTGVTEVGNSLGDIYAIFKTKTTQKPPLAP